MSSILLSFGTILYFIASIFVFICFVENNKVASEPRKRRPKRKKNILKKGQKAKKAGFGIIGMQVLGKGTKTEISQQRQSS